MQLAASWIRAGGVIAYPTEAVWGLGCDPANPDAVARLLTIKHRSYRKGLILIASDWTQLQPWLQTVSARQEKQLLDTWPGPTTWLIPAADDCPVWLTGDHSNLAVRVTTHPVVRSLCNSLDSPIVSTSANKSGRQAARSALGVRLQLSNDIDYLLPGELGGLERPSRIRDLASGRIIR